MANDILMNKRKNYISQDELDNDFKQLDSSSQQYFSRVNTNRQSIVKNDQISVWQSNSNNTKSMFSDQIFKVKLSKCNSTNQAELALGIHVIPTYDLDTQKDMGLIIQRIEPNGRVYKDGRMREGDRIVEINNTPLIGVDFKTAQKILREAINQSNDINSNVNLEFKLVRSISLEIDSDKEEEHNVEDTEEVKEHQIGDNYQEEEINERPIEIELNYNQSEYDNNDDNNKENNTVINTSFNNHLSAINMNALNTKKLGKIITVQLIKGPQGLGFKLAARDNCASGEYSPIYIKNILPKGAAITDGRLQRGDRLIEVDKIDMTKKTLHEAVNILRNTKLGACVEIAVSRQILPNLNNSQVESHALTQQQQSPIQLPREINDEHERNPNDSEPNQDQANRRQLLTFEIALNDTGSAGLGVSVKGKTKRIEETDCSIDLGIFIKIVINGGAAFKDGRLKPNDQLININGFSLLGKSNEEAMLILREAMQVESKPGHIQLTVSRKIKPTPTVPSPTNRIEQEPQETSPDSLKKIEKPIVKIINHSAQSPLKQPSLNNNKNSTPITTSSGRNREENNSRFARDAPSRRSMSEKRTKIGGNSMNKSQTTNQISRFQRNGNQASLIDTYPSTSLQPKRSQTVVGNPNMFISNRNSNPHEFRTLNKNFKIKTQINNQLKPKDLNTIISQESLISQSNLKKPNMINTDARTNLEANRIGSFESILSQTVTISSNTSNTIKEQEKIPNYQQPSLPPQQPREIKITNNTSHRRSISMETFQADQVISYNNENNIHVTNQIAQHNNNNQMNKYGTISGYTINKNKDQNSFVTTNQYTNQTYLTTNFNNNNHSGLVKDTQPVLSNNLTNTQTTDLNSVANIETNASNSRFRAINRSFRTAVDKSFDMPSNSETDEGQITKTEQIQQINKQKQQNKKSLIETFQSLFKNKKSQQQSRSGEPFQSPQLNVTNVNKATTVTNEHFNSVKPSIELLNYHKRNVDDFNPKNNFSIKHTNNSDQIMTNNANIQIPIETLIDNNTLYTQYKPQSSSSTTNELSTCTGISSSSSTSSASSTSATFIPKSNFNVNNRRDCIFYHSTDNYRLNNNYSSNHASRQIYRPLNRIENNTTSNHLQMISKENTTGVKMVVKHSQPFNGSKQIHTISDIFEEDKHILTSNPNGNEANFDRHNLNQLSTKSQPSLSSDKRSIYPTSYMQPKLTNNYINNGSSITNGGTNQHFVIKPNMILPHPADV